MLPRVTAETPVNGQLKGENGQASLNMTGTRMLPRVTAEMPKNGLSMGENMETGDVGRKRASIA
jgi:hypothetical protein